MGLSYIEIYGLLVFDVCKSANPSAEIAPWNDTKKGTA
jgi:hypothetical protein